MLPTGIMNLPSHFLQVQLTGRTSPSPQRITRKETYTKASGEAARRRDKGVGMQRTHQ
jgi:hypothetical protein